MTKEELDTLMERAIGIYNEEADNESQIVKEADLFGKNGQLDSLGLVNFLVIVEDLLREEHDIGIVIANERAISTKNSPFASIDALIAFVLEEIHRIKDAKNGHE